jgi:hypothetical protein
VSNSPTEREPALGVPDIRVPVFAPDGRRLHRFRQSSLKDTDICMERARFEMTGLMPKVENDAANVGTACHAGFELALYGLIDDGAVYGLDVCIEAAQDELTELMKSPYWRWAKFDEPSIRRFVVQVMTLWYERVLPTLDPVALEARFGPLVLWEDDERVIEVVGTIDYLDRAGLKDWKTGSREWKAWEHQRWDIQPTVYTWGAVESGLVVPDERGIVPFEFIVLWRKNGSTVALDRITVERHRGDWEWLRRKALNIAHLIEAEVPNWALNDNHALCSPTWCPAWKMCKGQHYTQQWPKPSRPAA